MIQQPYPRRSGRVNVSAARRSGQTVKRPVAAGGHRGKPHGDGRRAEVVPLVVGALRCYVTLDGPSVQRDVAEEQQGCLPAAGVLPVPPDVFFVVVRFILAGNGGAERGGRRHNPPAGARKSSRVSRLARSSKLSSARALATPPAR